LAWARPPEPPSARALSRPGKGVSRSWSTSDRVMRRGGVAPCRRPPRALPAGTQRADCRRPAAKNEEDAGGATTPSGPQACTARGLSRLYDARGILCARILRTETVANVRGVANPGRGVGWRRFHAQAGAMRLGASGKFVSPGPASTSTLVWISLLSERSMLRCDKVWVLIAPVNRRVYQLLILQLYLAHWVFPPPSFVTAYGAGFKEVGMKDTLGVLDLPTARRCRERDVLVDRAEPRRRRGNSHPKCATLLQGLKLLRPHEVGYLAVFRYVLGPTVREDQSFSKPPKTWVFKSSPRVVSNHAQRGPHAPRAPNVFGALGSCSPKKFAPIHERAAVGPTRLLCVKNKSTAGPRIFLA